MCGRGWEDGGTHPLVTALCQQLHTQDGIEDLV